MNWKPRLLTLTICCLALPAMGQLLKVHAELWQGDIYNSSKKRITDMTIVTKSGEQATVSVDRNRWKTSPTVNTAQS